MPTYVLMTKLSPEVTKRMKQRTELGKEWMEMVRKKCPEVKFLCHYALLGPYDFLDIYLSANCKFFIASASGLSGLPLIFRTYFLDDVSSKKVESDSDMASVLRQPLR